MLATMMTGACADQAPAPEQPAFRFPDQPNIILLVIDTLRRDHLSLYDYPRPTTPFLDRLASEGIAVENAWAQVPHTFLSTASLLCSQHFPLTSAGDRSLPNPALDAAGQRRKTAILLDDNLTLAEVFQASGYETVGIFTNPYLHPTSGFWQGFERPTYVLPQRKGLYGNVESVYSSFVDWLEERDSEDQASLRPFFAYVHLMDPHDPYWPPDEQRTRFGVQTRRGIKMSPQLSAEELADSQRLYDGEIHFVDQTLESLVKELRDRGLWQETILVVTADHGEEFMDHGGVKHGRTLYHELLRVPMLFAGAGLADHPAAGQRLGGVVRNLDLGPTLLELAGLTVPESFEGTSLAGILSDLSLGDSPVELAYARAPVSARIPELRSLTDGRWHLIVDVESGDRELYDLASDPAETKSIVTEHPELVDRLSKQIFELEQKLRSAKELARSIPVDQEVDPGTLEQLRALGYITE
jgi:arylsulfatase A-like enzyme